MHVGAQSGATHEHPIGVVVLRRGGQEVRSTVVLAQLLRHVRITVAPAKVPWLGAWVDKMQRNSRDSTPRIGMKFQLRISYIYVIYLLHS